MRRPCLESTVVLLTFAALAVASPATAFERWSGDTAETVAEGRWEAGLASPLRYGLTDDVELAAHPGWLLGLPNAAAKVAWTRSARWTISTEHSVAYPTLFLSLLARRGAGGVLPETSQVPQALLLDNTVLATAGLGDDYALTFETGVTVGPRLSVSDMPTIDFPFAYPRIAALHTLATPHAGAGFDAGLGESFGLTTDLDVFVIPGLGDLAFEQGASLIWSLTAQTRVLVGYRASMGSYPFGWDFKVLPTANIQSAWD